MSPIMKPGSKAFVVINPVSGFSNAQALKKICEQQFHAAGWSTRFHFTEEDQTLDKIVQDAVTSGFDLVVAAGGDGTIAAVAAGLLHSSVPLGIIPTGTWNAIARHLNLPASAARAIALMTGKHSIRKMDMMTIGNTIHAMNMGVGFSATMINNTVRAEKRMLGNFAYFGHAFKQILGLQMQRYVIEADGVTYQGRATEIMVANYGVIGLRFLEDRLNIHPDDGKVDVLILKARTVLDLPALAWRVFIRREKRTPKYRQLIACKNLMITTTPPAYVQADGELVGKTPVKVTVLPRSVQVIAP